MIRTLIILLCLATTVFGKLGETKPELIKRFGQSSISENSKSNGISFKGKNEVNILLYDGRSVMEIYTLKGKPDNSAVSEIVGITTGMPATRDNWETKTVQGFTCGYSQDGRFLSTILDDQGEYLILVGYVSPVTGFLEGLREEVAKEGLGPAPSAVPNDTPQDCGIIAAAAYKRLKDNAAWCQIIAIRGTKNHGVTYFGHAGVAYKFQADGEVYFYDRTGSTPLFTTATDAESLKAALNRKLDKVDNGYHVDNITFVTK